MKTVRSTHILAVLRGACLIPAIHNTVEAKAGGLFEFEASLIYIYSELWAIQGLIVRPYLKKQKVITSASTFKVRVCRLSFKSNHKSFKKNYHKNGHDTDMMGLCCWRACLPCPVNYKWGVV